MATITIRTDSKTDVLIEQLEKLHSNWKIKRNTIIKAAILSFYLMSDNDRETYLYQVRENDSRRKIRYSR